MTGQLLYMFSFVQSIVKVIQEEQQLKSKEEENTSEIQQQLKLDKLEGKGEVKAMP